MSKPVLKMESITKSYPGVKALNNVNLDAYAGEILGLLGANGAGKSTLMNVLGGLIQSDSGSKIIINGNDVEISNPIESVNYGIAFVQQELCLMPKMTIADNLFLTSFPTRFGVINYKETIRKCDQILQKLGYKFSPKRYVKDLGAGDRQIVQITRALLSDPKIIIFDESTSSLTKNEKEKLFEIIEKLKRDNVTIIYITHFLDEIFRLCDRAVVLRNGQTLGSGLVKDLDEKKIVEMMIGYNPADDINKKYNKKVTYQSSFLLKAENLHREKTFTDLSFSINSGEVVGLWGLLGSGRTELIRSLVGLDPLNNGKISINKSNMILNLRPKDLLKHVGIITEDRRDDGLSLQMSVIENMTSANLNGIVGPVWPMISDKKERELCKTFIEKLGIKISNVDQSVQTLSGGNQQKVIIARWLQRNPKIYLMDEPTRGLDVGAKEFVKKTITELSETGAGLLVIMSDLDELMSVADRFIVMKGGRFVAEYTNEEATKQSLMAAAAGSLGE